MQINSLNLISDVDKMIGNSNFAMENDHKKRILESTWKKHHKNTNKCMNMLPLFNDLNYAFIVCLFPD